MAFVFFKEGYFNEPDGDKVEKGYGIFSFLWCMLFGPIYFLSKGIKKHVIINASLLIITFGFSQLLYPFFAKHIVTKSYLKRGWILTHQYSLADKFDDLESYIIEYKAVKEAKEEMANGVIYDSDAAFEDLCDAINEIRERS